MPAYIKAFFSNQVGAPVLNGTVGSLINVLDACLVNGYNQVNVSSMTRSGSVVTVTTATNHGYENPLNTYWVTNGAGQVATISGAAETDYNGDWAITYISDTVFSFDIGAATPATPATGTITTKRAGGGWSKAFADTNRAAYRSNDLSSRRFFCQVNDVADCPNGQGARYAGMRGYEDMTGIDGGINGFPSLTQAGLFGVYIAKSSALDAGARGWALYTDGKAWYMSIHTDQGPGTAGSGQAASPVSVYSFVIGFGDLLSPIGLADPYACFCSGLSNGSSTYSATSNSGLFMAGGTGDPSPNTAQGWTALARRWTGAVLPVWSTSHLGWSFFATMSLGYNGGLMFPDGMSNRYPLAQVQCYEPGGSIGAVLRGAYGFYEGPCGVVHSNREIVTNITGREGRKFQYLRAGVQNSSYIGGCYVDLTGEANGKWS